MSVTDRQTDRLADSMYRASVRCEAKTTMNFRHNEQSTEATKSSTELVYY